MGALQVQPEPASAAFVRKQLRTELTERGVDEDSIDLVVLVSTELLGNVIRHCPPSPSGAVEVEWQLDDAVVTVRVADTCNELPRPRTPAVTEPTGRGLAIVEALSESWGVTAMNGGKRVWARIMVQRHRPRRSPLAQTVSP